MDNNYKLIVNGIISENPIFRLALSMCPAVAVTTTIKNGFLLGCAVLFVQVMSSVTVSIFKNFIHPRVRIVAFTIIIALWVSVIDMCLAAFFPAIYMQVSLYVKLIVAFAIIISRLELFASRNDVIPTFFDGVGMGFGFMIGLIVIGIVRELLGNGQLLGFNILNCKPLPIMMLPAGGFFVIGFLMAIMNALKIGTKKDN